MPRTRRSRATRNHSATNGPPRNVDANGQRIPRPPNAFMIFRTERASVGKDINDELNRKAREMGYDGHGYNNNKIVGDTSKVLGAVWRSMSDDEKNIYFVMQEEKNREHRLKYPHYLFQPVRSGKKAARAKRTATKTRRTAAKRNVKTGATATTSATVASAESEDDFGSSAPTASPIVNSPAPVTPSLALQISNPTSDIRAQDATADVPVPHSESQVTYTPLHLSLPPLSIPDGHYELSCTSTTAPSVSPIAPHRYQCLPWGLPPQDVFCGSLQDGGQPMVMYQNPNVFYPTDGLYQQGEGYLTGSHLMNDQYQPSLQDNELSSLIDQPAHYYPTSDPVPVAGPSSLVEELYGDGVIPNDYDLAVNAGSSWNTEAPIPESAEVDLSFADVSQLPPGMYQEWMSVAPSEYSGVSFE
ncbi:hypothetical protein E1B28_009436 [Marasmius oreades]|uniref:HMG box domain-containing protein n=1 Tax=Marasmius oreades TaxID=181124 RepID=A0A9P7UT61_9AGAR|nr:uncharacterized protein E1B28_009436 [Marasmius oreades]KAG7093153.1 hypothetical protein E1B28_009436 [Marasmius oreades]